MTRRALMLHLLREAGDRGITTSELLQAGVGSRYGARLLELREQGHVVEAARLRDGSWRYVLVHDIGRDIDPAAGAPSLRPKAAPPAAVGISPGVGRHPGQSSQVAPAALPTLFDVPSPGFYDVDAAA